MKEIWKDVVGYENLYEVSNLGRVRSKERYVKYTKWKTGNYLQFRKSKILTPAITKNGYLRVEMSNDGHHKLNLVHRMVAQAFIPNAKNYKQVNHINCNKQDNRVENLEWCSSKENMEHAWKNNLYKGKRVAKYKDGKLIATYITIVEASKSCGSKTSGQNICKVAKGKRKTAFGYEWKYI